MKLPYFFADKLNELGLDVDNWTSYNLYELSLTLKYYYPSIAWRDFNLLKNNSGKYLDLNSTEFQQKLQQQRRMVSCAVDVHQKWFDVLYDYACTIADGQIPMVAMVVHNGVIVSKFCNNSSNCLLHAESLAIDMAMKSLGQKYLYDCVLYCNFEPCLMCSGVIWLSRIKAIFFNNLEPDTGCLVSQNKVLDNSILNSHTLYAQIKYKEERNINLLRQFFSEKRKNIR